MRTKPFGRGLPAYCTLLAALSEPRTVTELTIMLCGRYRSGARAGISLALREMRMAGLIHISDWRHSRSDGTGPFASVWALGRLVDAAPPTRVRLELDVTCLRSEMLAFTKAVECIQSGPSTVREIREFSGIGKGPVIKLTRILRAANLIRIAGWEPAGHMLAPAWAWGGGKNAQRPPKKTRNEIDRAYRARSIARRDQLMVLRALAANDHRQAEAA